MKDNINGSGHVTKMAAMAINSNIAYTSLIKFLCILSSLNHEVGIWFQL